MRDDIGELVNSTIQIYRSCYVKRLDTYDVLPIALEYLRRRKDKNSRQFQRTKRRGVSRQNFAKSWREERRLDECRRTIRRVVLPLETRLVFSISKNSISVRASAKPRIFFTFRTMTMTMAMALGVC